MDYVAVAPWGVVLGSGVVRCVGKPFEGNSSPAILKAQWFPTKSGRRGVNLQGASPVRQITPLGKTWAEISQVRGASMYAFTASPEEFVRVAYFLRNPAESECYTPKETSVVGKDLEGGSDMF